VDDDEEKPWKANRNGARYSEETAERIYGLLVAGIPVSSIAFQIGLTPVQIFNLRSGVVKSYRYLYLKYESRLPKVRRIGPRAKSENLEKDRFTQRGCSPGLRHRADYELLLDPWRVYKLSLTHPNLMPMNKPRKRKKKK
jgi:hypothetical protein